ncbi:MAG TPA: alpha/beta fold hydrolase [Allosphingosinicella sp.]|jgi:hypothetical protein
MVAIWMTAVALAGATPADATGVEMVVQGPSGRLAGTFIGTSDPAAPVVIIPGSGPTDRDGNGPLGLKGAPYRMLAEGLAARGVPSVRIDKRGMFASAAAAADANAVTIADYAADVRSWIDAARQRTGARCAWLLGHSEGGLVALVAAQAPEGVCGVILVSAPGRRLSDVMREQLRANPANAPLLDQALAAIDALESGKHVDPSGLHPALTPLFAPAVQGFVISLFSYDPAELAAKVSKPILIVQGQRDLQVGETDARRMAAANPRATLVLLPDVNHVLKSVPAGDTAANLAAYGDPALPIAPGAVEAIAGFISAQKK